MQYSDGECCRITYCPSVSWHCVPVYEPHSFSASAVFSAGVSRRVFDTLYGFSIRAVDTQVAVTGGVVRSFPAVLWVVLELSPVANERRAQRRAQMTVV